MEGRIGGGSSSNVLRTKLAAFDGEVGGVCQCLTTNTTNAQHPCRKKHISLTQNCENHECRNHWRKYAMACMHWFLKSQSATTSLHVEVLRKISECASTITQASEFAYHLCKTMKCPFCVQTYETFRSGRCWRRLNAQHRQLQHKYGVLHLHFIVTFSYSTCILIAQWKQLRFWPYGPYWLYGQYQTLLSNPLWL